MQEVLRLLALLPDEAHDLLRRQEGPGWALWEENGRPLSHLLEREDLAGETEPSRTYWLPCDPGSVLEAAAEFARARGPIDTSWQLRQDRGQVGAELPSLRVWSNKQLPRAKTGGRLVTALQAFAHLVATFEQARKRGGT